MLTLKVLLNLLVYWVSFLIPRDKRLAAFGAWMGDRYCDNPKYLMLYLLEHSNMKCVWIGKEELRDQMPSHANFRFVRKDSIRACWFLLRAKFWFYCHHYGDMSELYLDNGAIVVNLWHGIPLKYMGVKTPYAIAHPTVRKGIRALRHNVFSKLRKTNVLWTVSSSKGMSRIMVESFPSMYSYERILEYGTPRNDFLIRHACDKERINALKQKYSRILGFSVDKRIVLYMPTWRMANNSIFTFYGLPADKCAQFSKMFLEKDAVLIEKHHHATFEKQPIDARANACSIVVSPSQQNQIDPQELYLIADLMVTDYSSAYFDFSLLKRPCIHFVYDYDQYKNNDSGLAYDLEDVAAGPCVRTVDELYVELERLLSQPEFRPSSGLQKLVEFETGRCSEQILSFMLNHR